LLVKIKREIKVKLVYQRIQTQDLLFQRKYSPPLHHIGVCDHCEIVFLLKTSVHLSPTKKYPTVTRIIFYKIENHDMKTITRIVSNKSEKGEDKGKTHVAI
jgi:hypothetical protein